MAISKEVRRLEAKWKTGSGWPKRLDWIEIDGIRGWTGQRFDLQFPIMVIVGENGAGKSTVLQSAASVYGSPTPKSAPSSRHKERYASDFFLDTPWDRVSKAEVRYAVREAGKPHQSSIRRPTDRWRGNPERRKRNVEYIDLSRIQPVPARTGYSKLANPQLQEISSTPFEKRKLGRFSEIMGRTYELAKMALTNGDDHRSVAVITQQGSTYSGFHQGAGETTIADLLEVDIPAGSLVLIDEIESSLHPRAQRRLIRDLAERCREGELQIVISTHSPYVLEELPPEARAYIMQGHEGRREIVYGVSPEFAMTQMDDMTHHECDLYVEDSRAEGMLVEILIAANPGLVQRCQIIRFGAASVGQALGQMVTKNRFPRPSAVFLDGDRGVAPGCLVLPGEDAPERVVFEALRDQKWNGIDKRIGRSYAKVVDACDKAMALVDHHGWVDHAAQLLVVGGDGLWQAMCAEWANACLPEDEASAISLAVEDLLTGIGSEVLPIAPTARPPAVAIPPVDPPGPHKTETTESQQPFELFENAPQP